LGPWATYFSTLKGFVAIGILYMPKNCLNGGWLVSLVAMVFSFLITYYSVIKLLEAREKLPQGGSYSDISAAALGKKAKYIVDVFLFIMQLGFVIGLAYFAMKSMKSVIEGISGKEIDIIYVGKHIYCLDYILAIGLFVVTGPICLVRRIEKFAFTHAIADVLIFVTAIMIIVFGFFKVKEKGWGHDIKLFNEATWLSIIGSAIYSYEGIGVVLPIVEVTENPK
jgi:solute carrier family 36 (proton-coupled amino acid transporter)